MKMLFWLSLTTTVENFNDYLVETTACLFTAVESSSLSPLAHHATFFFSREFAGVVRVLFMCVVVVSAAARQRGLGSSADARPGLPVGSSGDDN